MESSDWMATNNESNPNKVQPSVAKTATTSENSIDVKLAPVSWQVIHVSVETD
jgi:alpha-L-arabinofuranosidase